MFNCDRKDNPIIDLEVVDNILKVEVEFFREKQFTFNDEFDIIVLSKISKVENLEPSQIILSGIFRELMELSYNVSYEDECYVKNHIEDYCKYIFNNQ